VLLKEEKEGDCSVLCTELGVASQGEMTYSFYKIKKIIKTYSIEIERSFKRAKFLCSSRGI
jgi:hypothetical protein